MTDVCVHFLLDSLAEKSSNFGDKASSKKCRLIYETNSLTTGLSLKRRPLRTPWIDLDYSQPVKAFPTGCRFPNGR